MKQWIIETNYNGTWEIESTYTNEEYTDPEKEAKKDLEEYKLIADRQGGEVRLTVKEI